MTDKVHLRHLINDLKDLVEKIQNEIECEHKHYTPLDFFDGDGGIVVQRVKCNDCGQYNTQCFGEAIEPNLWTGRDDKEYVGCRHQMYREKNWRYHKKSVVCQAECQDCDKEIIHIHPFEAKPDKGWWHE